MTNPNGVQTVQPPALSDLLRDWVDAGLITPEQSRSIRTYEAGSRPPRPGPDVVEPTLRPRSLVVEVLGYLGGIVMMVGATILVGLQWPDLAVGSRLTIVGLTALALVAAGFAVPQRLGDAAARLRSVLWAAGVVATGGFFTVVTDAWHRYDEDALIIIGPTSALLATFLWWLHRRSLQQVALLVPLLLSVAALALQLNGDEALAPGLAVWSTAVTWTVLAWAGRIPPRVSGVAFGAFGALFGSMIMGNDIGIAIGLLTGVAMAALALSESSLPWLGVAAVTMLYASPRAALEWLPGRLSAALTLIVTGAVLVIAAVWVARHRATPVTGPAVVRGEQR